MRNATNLLSTIDRLFEDFDKFSVGFRPTFEMLDNVRTLSGNTSYPPYDLESTGDNKYKLSMAVAGFTADDIDVSLHNGILTIEGKSKKEEAKTFLHKGIAARSFKKSFYLNAWIKVTGSLLDNGILTIDFEQELPESMKPQKIMITNHNKNNLIESSDS